MKNYNSKRLAPFVILAFTVTVNLGAASSQIELQPADLVLGDHFGRSVAAGGSILAAGAFAPAQPGTVYTYQRSGNNWIEQAELQAPNPAANDEFGISVATDGTTLVVGAAASTYILVNSNGIWTIQAVLPVAGTTVALSRDTVAVGSGAQVSLFRSNNAGAWAIEAMLPIRQSAGSVALDGDTLLVGSPFAATPLGNEVGLAYVFVRNRTVWSQQATLAANDPAAFAMFGVSVSVSGETAVVGAPGEGTDPLNELDGSTYVFVRSNNVWTRQAEIIGPDDGSDFGTSLAVNGNTLVIGAYDDTIALSGSAFLYTRNGSSWIQVAEYLPQNGVANQRFANTVAMVDPNTFVFGAPNFPTPVPNAGAIYVVGR